MKKKKNHIWGILGNPYIELTQVNKNVSAVRYHHRADICVTKEQNNHQFFIYVHFLLFGGPWVDHKISDRAHLASHPSSRLYQSTYKICNQSDKDSLSFRENDDMSADADADADADIYLCYTAQ